MKIKQDPITKLWARSDGAILLPPSRRGGMHYRWTFGTKRRDGYRCVRYLGKDHRVHRIIARAFIPNPDNLPTIDHMDRCPSNNSVSNLRWATYKTQADNHGKVLNRADYGVRACEDIKAYNAALYAAHRAEKKAQGIAYYAKKKAAGFVYRKGPDGRQRWVLKSL